MSARTSLAVLGIVLVVVAGFVAVDDRAVDIGDVYLGAAVTSGAGTADATPSDATPIPWPAPADDVGGAIAPAPSTPAPVATSPPAPVPTTPVPTDSSDSTTPSVASPPVRDVGQRDARIRTRDGSATSPAPTRLRLPSLDLDLPIVAVGVSDDGEMEVPAAVDDVGWYRHGPVPGEPGNAVVAGHVDSRTQGLGAFHRLVDLAVGDRVVVTDEEGRDRAWTVTGRRLLDKDDLDPADLFRRDGDARLVLVTCGGEFDGSARSYRSNVVVVADRA